MATLGTIRRMYFRDGLSLSEISRRTSLARNTIKQWLKKPDGAEPKYRCQSRPGKLTPYETTLTHVLDVDARRPKRDRRTARALFAEIHDLCATVAKYALSPQDMPVCKVVDEDWAFHQPRF